MSPKEAIATATKEFRDSIDQKSLDEFSSTYFQDVYVEAFCDTLRRYSIERRVAGSIYLLTKYAVFVVEFRENSNAVASLFVQPLSQVKNASVDFGARSAVLKMKLETDQYHLTLDCPEPTESHKLFMAAVLHRLAGN